MKGKAHDAPATTDNDWWSSRNHVQTLVLVVATGMGMYLCYLLARPFLSAIAWALALAVLFVPFHRWVESKVRHPNLAATLTVLVVVLIVVVPFTFVGQQLILEAMVGADTIRTKVEAGDWRRGLESHAFLSSMTGRVERQIDLRGTVGAVTTWLTNTATSFLKGSVMGLLQFCIIFYLLYYFLRDTKNALRSLRSLSPLSKPEMDQLCHRVVDTIHATVYGTLAVAAIQGTLGGLMFWWLGLPAPLLWGIVMGLLAVVPVLGAFVVWIPAVIFLVLEGTWAKGLILALWGGVVIGGIDNILYPILVGNRLHLHTVVAFISIVGGLILFGAAGIILGPIALTVTTTLLEIWRQRTPEEAAAADVRRL